ncbi:MAG: hypothetical protein JW984_15255 [Deltaproteobacteria bacterium]|uniref:DUF3168 domain-containing protein n=1 Tax=Candidatus Zymogenus saltonus TaxID=2844893 RepID=A0A9D8KHJ5_9DELT|nr:hypothetical protein [Candidatus Zymogenus saltonus]
MSDSFLETFLDKIYERWVADGELSAAATLYYDSAEDPTFPFVTYHLVSGDQTAIFSGAMERPTIQFSVWSKENAKDEALGIVNGICRVFDHCGLDFGAGYDTRKFERVRFDIKREDYVWHAQVDYDIEVVAA